MIMVRFILLLATCGEAIGCDRRYDDISWNYKVNPLTLQKGKF